MFASIASFKAQYMYFKIHKLYKRTVSSATLNIRGPPAVVQSDPFDARVTYLHNDLQPITTDTLFRIKFNLGLELSH